MREGGGKHLSHGVHVEVRGQLGHICPLFPHVGLGQVGFGSRCLSLWAILLADHPYCDMFRESFLKPFQMFRGIFFSLLEFSKCLTVLYLTLFDFGFLRHWSPGVCHFSSVARAWLYVKSVSLDITFLLGNINRFDFTTLFRARLKNKH